LTPVLAVRLETAFDPLKSIACIGLAQASRDSAAAWLPPGMAYAGGDSLDTQSDDASHIGSDPGDAEPAEINISSTDLPAFLTEDEPVGGALNGASAP